MAGLKKLRQREEIDDRYKWNIAAMYGDEKEWEKDFKESEKMAEEFSAYSEGFPGRGSSSFGSQRPGQAVDEGGKSLCVFSDEKRRR